MADNIQQFSLTQNVFEFGEFGANKSTGQVIQTQSCGWRLLWWSESKNGYFERKCVFFQASLLLSLYVFVKCV